MLAAVVVILIVLWVIGMVSGVLFGGLIHLLLLAAAVMFIIRIAHPGDPLRRG
jgi:hypothetical protein